MGVHLPALPRDPRLVDRRPELAHADAWRVIRWERSLDLFHEVALQELLEPFEGFFSTYYMLGFGPVLASILVWLAGSRRRYYRELRTLLFISLGIALVVYLAFPTAPPRLVPGLGIADTVGLSGHDTGSFAGVRFNPYAAMPSLHVGWSILAADRALPRDLAAPGCAWPPCSTPC